MVRGSRLTAAVFVMIVLLLVVTSMADVPVIDPSNPTGEEGNPSIASATDGELFVAVEDLNLQWTYIYHSTDNGKTWSYLWGITGGPSGYETANPSIAVGEDDYNVTWVYVAFEAKHADGSKSVDLLRFQADDPVGTADYETVASNIVGMANPIYPEVCTDSPPYVGPEHNVYIVFNRFNTIESVHEVVFMLSEDQGDTWGSLFVHASDAHPGKRPHVTFGGPLGFPGDAFRVTVAFERAVEVTAGVWKRDVWARVSRDFGATWDAAVRLTTSNDDESEPRVAAALNGTDVVVAYTRDWGNSGDMDVWYAYSNNAGVNWTTNQALATSSSADEVTPDIAIVFDDRFHCVYWSEWDIFYRWADDTTPTVWSTPVVVNELNWGYTNPSVAASPSMPESLEASIAWTDYRGADRKAYFDRDTDVFADGFESGSTSAWSMTFP